VVNDVHCYTETESIKQLRVECNECNFTVFSGCCVYILDQGFSNFSAGIPLYVI
jgi:hypothetical protein